MEATTSVKQTNPVRYSVGFFGLSIPINMFRIYAAYFYVNYLGAVTTQQLALIMFIYAFIDALDNPVYGLLSDRLRTPWGRRKPLMVLGAPLLVLSLVMFFNPPDVMAQGSLFWYMLVMYILTGTLDSFVGSSYGALFPELFKSEGIRSRTNAIRQAFQLVAMVISIALTPVVADAIGYSLTSILYGLLALAAIWYMAFGCHEDPEASKTPKPEFFKSVWQILTNSKFWIFGVTNALYYGGQGTLLVAVPFYVYHTLGLGALQATILQGAIIAVAISCIPVWVRITRRLGLMKTWRTALIVISVSFIPMYFVNSLVTAVVAMSFFGFGIAGAFATIDVVGARILDDDAQRHGVRREGFFSSVGGVLNRLSGLFGALAFLLVYTIFAFESGESPGPNPAAAARFLLVVFPFCTVVLSACTSFALRFKNRDEVTSEAANPES